MNFDAYWAALSQLPITNPSFADLQSIAPHLTNKQIAKVFAPDDGKTSAYVAIPPTTVRHGYLVARYSIYGEPHLEIAFAKRTLASYADGKPHGDVFYNKPFDKEAMAYAQAHWGDRLILDTWQDIGDVYVQDPTDLYTSGGWPYEGSPKTKRLVYWATNRGWNEIGNDRSAPHSTLWNSALAFVTLSYIQYQEIKGGRGAYTEFNCANCGGGLGLDGCTHCGYRFTDNHFRCGWGTPLPQRIINLLREAGHVFRVDPSHAQQVELANWQQYVARWGNR